MLSHHRLEHMQHMPKRSKWRGGRMVAAIQVRWAGYADMMRFWKINQPRTAREWANESARRSLGSMVGHIVMFL